jgi:hypothetical protein
VAAALTHGSVGNGNVDVGTTIASLNLSVTYN